jgi:hypothetical protein
MGINVEVKKCLRLYLNAATGGFLPEFGRFAWKNRAAAALGLQGEFRPIFTLYEA